MILPRGTCNGVKTLLVHESLLQAIWLDIARMLLAVDVRLLSDESRQTLTLPNTSH